MLRRGCQRGVSGAPWLVYGPENRFPVFALTWGTRARAFYAAEESCRDANGQVTNPLIQHSLERGLEGCVILEWNTPRRGLVWVRDYHNQFHTGASYSWLELLTEIPDMEK
eukprot:6836946-Pyramimonas_sp.AAC.2